MTMWDHTFSICLSSCRCDTGDLQRLSDYPVDECGPVELTGSGLAAGSIDTFCTERCGRPLLDFHQRCGLDELTANLVYTCSMNANMETCGAIRQNTISLATAAVSTCLGAFSESSSCSDACRANLQQLRSEAGCCGNFTQTQLVFPADISDFNLWNTCNVTVTGVCTEGVFNSGKGLITTKISFVGLAVLAVAAMLL